MTVREQAPGIGDWIAEALRLADRNVAAGGGPFGALVVHDGRTVSTGINRVTTDLDPTAHAEVTAIRGACRALGRFALTGCTLVTSCEPCPMCLTSALWARLDRIVYAADRDDAARAGFDDRAFYDLMARPREMWPVSVERVDAADRTRPFDSWLAKPDRVAY
jgi:tRNA(Arg) A34 adenosine deaminase TadA